MMSFCETQAAHNKKPQDSISNWFLSCLFCVNSTGSSLELAFYS